MVGKITMILDLIKSKIIDKIDNKYKYNNYLSSNSCILKMYYIFGTLLSFILASCIFYNIFMSTSIICVDGHGGHDTKIRFVLVNFCFSYPSLATGKKENKFALFYKWVPWMFICLCISFASVKGVIYFRSCSYTAKSLLKIVRENDEISDYYTVKEEEEKNCKTIINNDYKTLKDFIDIKWNKCKSLYWNCVFCHLYSLFLNIVIFTYLDFFLQGQFFMYIPHSFPFKRDPENFSDHMTQTFYPFVECNITMGLLQHGRTETYLCHLTLMEFYEKIFFILWIFLSVVFIFNIVYLVYLLIFLWSNNYNSFLEYLLKKYLDHDLYIRAKNYINKNAEI